MRPWTSWKLQYPVEHVVVVPINLDCMDVSLGKKSQLNKANRIKHLNDGKIYQDKAMAFWKHVLWSDKSK